MTFAPGQRVVARRNSRLVMEVVGEQDGYYRCRVVKARKEDNHRVGARTAHAAPGGQMTLHEVLPVFAVDDLIDEGRVIAKRTALPEAFAKFDPDGDGKPGGSVKRTRVKNQIVKPEELGLKSVAAVKRGAAIKGKVRNN